MNKTNRCHVIIAVILLLIIAGLANRCYRQSVQLERYSGQIDAYFLSSMGSVYGVLATDPDAPDNTVAADSIRHIAVCRVLISMSSYADHTSLQKSLTIMQNLAQNGHFSVLNTYPGFCENFGRLIYTGYPSDVEEALLQTLQEIAAIYLK